MCTCRRRIGGGEAGGWESREECGAGTQMVEDRAEPRQRPRGGEERLIGETFRRLGGRLWD